MARKQPSKALAICFMVLVATRIAPGGRNWLKAESLARNEDPSRISTHAPRWPKPALAGFFRAVVLSRAFALRLGKKQPLTPAAEEWARIDYILSRDHVDRAHRVMVIVGDFHFDVAPVGERLGWNADDLPQSAGRDVGFDAPADADYGAIRASLEKSGRPIGGNDLLIAAQARSSGLTLVTRNVGEFSRVEGLRVEDWLG